MHKLIAQLSLLGILFLLCTFNTNAYTVDKSRTAFPYIALASDQSKSGQSADRLDEAKEKLNQANKELQTSWNKTVANPLDGYTGEKLKKMISEEADRQGLLTGLMSGMMLLYSTLSDLLLHPVLIIVLILVTLGLLIIGLIIFLRIRNENFTRLGRLISLGIIYLLLYIDLLLIMYETRKTTMALFRWEKDIILVILAMFVGYIAGRYASQKSFEEKVLP